MYDGLQFDAGRLQLYRGSAAGLLSTATWEIEGDSSGAWFGQVLAPLGDVDGDEFFDLGVSAPGSGSDYAGAGVVHVYRSNRLSRPLLIPEQERFDGSTIGLLGFSEDNNDFRLKVRVPVPPGSSKMRLQWQAEYPTYPLDDSPVKSGSIHNVQRPYGANGLNWIELTESVNKPLARNLVRWRVRVVTGLPAQPYTKWFSHPGITTNEPSLRFGYPPTIPAPPNDTIPPPQVEPVQYSLYFNPAYPNPFKASTRMQFTLPDRGMVDIKIYNIAGELVKRISSGERQDGPHSVTWDGRAESGQRVASGIYLARFEYHNQVIMRKLVLIR
jgi:hypothetical protein